MKPPHLILARKEDDGGDSGGPSGGDDGTTTTTTESLEYVIALEEDEEDFGDPCNEFAHSVLFFIILVVAFALIVCYCVLLAKKYAS